MIKFFKNLTLISKAKKAWKEIKELSQYSDDVKFHIASIKCGFEGLSEHDSRHGDLWKEINEVLD